jgi:hypothetical protein
MTKMQYTTSDIECFCTGFEHERQSEAIIILGPEFVYDPVPIGKLIPQTLTRKRPIIGVSRASKLQVL